MAKRMTKAEKDKMLNERYGNCFVSPPYKEPKKNGKKKATPKR